jgi:predicted TIM-barrel fold metal-dependent hydrolase
MAGFAACPNVAVKISGLGQGAGNWPVTQNQAIARSTIELFGIERCMFASNFPVDSLCASFDTIYSAWEAAVQDLAVGEQRALFHDNAVRLYAME